MEDLLAAFSATKGFESVISSTLLLGRVKLVVGRYRGHIDFKRRDSLSKSCTFRVQGDATFTVVAIGAVVTIVFTIATTMHILHLLIPIIRASRPVPVPSLVVTLATIIFAR